MKQPGEELQETLTELDDRAVVDYLIKNPEFFIRNARAVEAIRRYICRDQGDSDKNYFGELPAGMFHLPVMFTECFTPSGCIA